MGHSKVLYLMIWWSLFDLLTDVHVGCCGMATNSEYNPEIKHTLQIYFICLTEIMSKMKIIKKKKSAKTFQLKE